MCYYFYTNSAFDPADTKQSVSHVKREMEWSWFSTNLGYKIVWQLQPIVAQTVQQRATYEFISMRRTCDYI